MTNRINGGPTGSDAIDAIDAVEKARAAEEVEGASGFDAVMAGQQVDAAGERRTEASTGARTLVSTTLGRFGPAPPSPSATLGVAG